MYRLQQLRLEARQALHESQAELLLTPTVGATYAIQERPMPIVGKGREPMRIRGKATGNLRQDVDDIVAM